MKIKTSYDCTFEPRDMTNLANGRALSATLSDGTIAFRFQLDPDLLQNGTPRLMKGTDEPQRTPRMLTDGAPKKSKYKPGPRGMCPYCKPPRGPMLLDPHIRVYHPGKPAHLTGAFKCPKCPARFETKGGLGTHLGSPVHRVKKTKGEVTQA